MGEEMVGEEGRKAVVGEEGEGSEREASAGAEACSLRELGWCGLRRRQKASI